jgi:hypothetical protein
MEEATMTAFAVKHIVEDQGPLASIMKKVRKDPYSYTSKEPEASQACYGGDIYVIEVRGAGKSARTYWLGYKYRAYEKYMRPGGALWPGDFKFKNAGRPSVLAEGAYFDVPVEITDAPLTEWLREKQRGMSEIPGHLVSAIDFIIKDPAHGAKEFA